MISSISAMSEETNDRETTIEGALEEQLNLSPSVRNESPSSFTHRVHQSSPSIMAMSNGMMDNNMPFATTPVICNTSQQEEQFFDAIVSPEDVNQNEGLVLPDDDDDGLAFGGGGRYDETTNHSAPPMKRRSSFQRSDQLNKPLPLRKFLSFGNKPPCDLELPPYVPKREEEKFEEVDLQQIFNPIPLASQRSIPSIRLANQFEDDEESWSSRSSCLFFSEEEIIHEEQQAQPLGHQQQHHHHHAHYQHQPRQQQQPIVVVESSSCLKDGPFLVPTFEQETAARQQEEQHDFQHHLRQQLLQPSSDYSTDAVCYSAHPYEWLRTVNAEQNEIAEAASSKFLTKGSTFVRQQSSPPSMEAFADSL